MTEWSAGAARALSLRRGRRIPPTLPIGSVPRIPPGDERGRRVQAAGRLSASPHGAPRSPIHRGGGWYGRRVLGTRSGIVRQLRPVDIHGARFVDVTVVLDDGSMLEGRLGAESVPADLHHGDHVLAVAVMSTLVEIRRPA